MDGLSAAASVIGVVSLAVQLAGGAHTLLKFLKTISDAPAEIIRLQDLLTQIHAVIIGIQNAFQYQRQLHGDGAPVANDIHMALLICQKKIQSFCKILDEAENIQHGRNAIIFRKWAHFKLALKKEDIGDLEQQLGHTLQVLHISLTVNSMTMSARNTTILLDWLQTSTYQTQLAVSPSSTSTISTDDRDVLAVKPIYTKNNQQGHAALSNQFIHIRTSTYKNFSSWLGKYTAHTIRTQLKNPSQDRRCVHEQDKTETHYSFAPSFLTWSIHISFGKSGFSSSRMSVTLDRVMPTAAYHKFQKILRNDDVTGLFQMLNTNELSLSMTTSNGRTPFGLTYMESARGKGIPDQIFSFLERQEKTLSLIEIRNCFFVLSLSKLTVPENLRVFKSICSHFAYQDLSLETLFDSITYNPLRPSILEFFLESIEWVVFSSLGKNWIPTPTYLGSALYILAGIKHGKLSEESIGQYHRLTKKLLVMGAELHYVNENGMTILERLLCDHPPGYDAHISDWLVLLAGLKVNVGEYLRKELGLRDHGWMDFQLARFCTTNRYICWGLRMIEYVNGDEYGQPQIGVIRYVDQEGPAALVLQEFDFSPELDINCGIDCVEYQDLIKFGQDRAYCLPACLLEQPIRKSLPSLCKSDSEYDPIISEDILSSISRLEKTFHLNVLCPCDLAGNYLDLWPFNGQTHTMCRTGNHLDDLCLGTDAWCQGGHGIPGYICRPWCSLHRCTFNHARFERKQAKKEMKRITKLRMKFVDLRIPGAWIE